MTDYYDVRLKRMRLEMLATNAQFTFVEKRIEEPTVLMQLFETYKPNAVVHLAAQAGVRYSIENPRSYLESNIVGTFELLEAARAYPPDHMLLASTSSAYGANEKMPFAETDKCDNQVSFYAATKKATENMAHSYAHLFDLPVTMFRFFTVYGPWGRPDMAPMKFAKAILAGDPIDIYNNGEMKRDFTYIADLVEAVFRIIQTSPPGAKREQPIPGDSLSPVAPFRVLNIGTSSPVQLMDFIATLEKETGAQAVKNFMAMQSGDVVATWADSSLLKNLTGYQPDTSLAQGLSEFVAWYKEYAAVSK